MTILKMTATFGKLAHETLELTPGLNIFTYPNEQGKSTWTAFFTAMFYGVETSVRATQNNLPIKKKYKPWSGESMAGVIELVCDGRHITIERKTHGSVPLGEFRAYDTLTGQDIAGLNAENCGQILLGCERSVFERSALLAQNALTVSSDDALSRRLSALVSSGEETVSFTDTQKVLHGAKNRIKNTLLKQEQQTLEKTEAALRQIREQHENDLHFRAEQEATVQQVQQLNDILRGFAAQEALAKQAQREESAQAVQDCETKLAACRETVKHLPAQGVLETLEKALCEEPSLPEKPVFSGEKAAFSGLSAESARQMAKQDLAAYDRLAAQKSPAVRPLFAAGGLALLLAAVLLLLGQTVFGLCLLIPALGFAAFGAAAHSKGKKAAENALAQQTILQKYGVLSRDEIPAAAAEYAAQRDAFTEQSAQYTAAVSAEKERTARLLGQVSMFCPEAADKSSALSAVRQALAQYAALHAAEQALEFSQKQYAAVCAALGEQAEFSAPTVDLTGYTRQSAQQALQAAQARQTALQEQLSVGLGRVAALGDPAGLTAKKEASEQRISELSEALAAFTLAEDTLAEANEALQTRFSPQLCRLAGSILEKLTASRYDALTLDTSMKTTAREADGSLTRELGFLSSGTADQVYLALRLAIAELVLPGDTPLVLDDALLRFDDVRAKAALALLQAQSKSRQLLLFTCHSREAAMLKEGIQ